MQTDNEHLHCLGMGLDGLRASGQFCDAMVCVGSTRILVHKVVISAASKTLHDLALEFDMMPHRERDQLEIIIPPDISLYAVNMFIKYLYTGQLELREMIVGHMLRLAQIFGVTSLQHRCQEYTQQISAPDSQNLNLGGEERIEPDSSSANGNHLARHEDTSDDSMVASLTRSNSSCSGVSSEIPLNLKNVKLEPHQRNSTGVKPGPSSMKFKQAADKQKKPVPSSFSLSKQSQDPKTMNMLEKLMSPVVNIQKLPSEITPDVVVMVSDDEDSEMGSPSRLRIKPSHHYTLAEKEAIAVEAKRYGTTHVANTHNIPLPDVLSWMSLFGLRQPGGQKTLNRGKPVNHEADIAIVRWIVQHQDMNGCVDLGAMKQYALTVYRQSQPKFTASVTWLGNFLKRNMSVLQGTKFVQGSENSLSASPSVSVKRELMSVEDLAELNPPETHSSEDAMEHMSENPMFDDASYNDDDYDDGDNEDSGLNDFSLNESTESTSHQSTSTLSQQSTSTPIHNRAVGVANLPFGRRPIIVGQSKSFDVKSEKKIVQWVLERNARDGYVFTDDFKDYARSLYTGSKPFGATKAWMDKFLRRHRAIKDVKFCSKFKNMYTNEEKMAAVVMARKYGTTYAAKHTGINQKMVHCWRLAMDRGQLSPSGSVLSRLEAMTSRIPDLSGSSTSESSSTAPVAQALHGIIPEFERQIIQRMRKHQAREGSISYSEISKISQEIYKETRPTFKASYSWIKAFFDRNKEETKDIEIENVNKVIMEDKSMSQDQISEMVDNALKEIESQGSERVDGESLPATGVPIPGFTADRRPIIVGPSVMFDRKTEKQMVEWALERQQRDGYVFTDDFKDFAKSLHTGPKRFSASSGWMTLFLRRHRDLRVVKWKSKFKNNYTEEEKLAAIAEAKRLGTGHVGRKLGIDPALICAWRIKLEKTAQKQTFWKGTKIRKFGKNLKHVHQKLAPIKLSPTAQQSDAARGIVPEFEQRIVEKIQEEHEKEGSISYEIMSSISQSIYKETRPTFKASYAWIRNFMKRHESELANLNIDNVKKVFYPEDEEDQFSNTGSQQGSFLSNHDDSSDIKVPSSLFQKRPIIVGQSRSLDTKTEKKLVQWLQEQQEKNGYVFLDQFKSYAQSLYSGTKKFAATQAWRIKFLRRNHAAVKHVKFTSSFRNQYSVEEKRAIVLEARRLGAAHVAKKTGIDHSQINAWRLKMERNGEMPADTGAATPSPSSSRTTWASKLVAEADFVARKITPGDDLGPGLYSHRGIVPKFEKKIVEMVNNHMDDNGSVTYQDVSNIARAVYKETRPHFKACYNWIKEFIKRHKKGLRHVEFEHTRKILLEDSSGMEVLIPEDRMDELDLETYMPGGREPSVESWESFGASTETANNPEIVIENAEDPNADTSVFNKSGESSKKSGSVDLDEIVSKRPIIIGTPVHFDRKTEKKIVAWLLERQARDEYVFTDDLRIFARSLYTGPPNKFAATNAWISKFLRRHKLKNKIVFQSKLKGNNTKFEEKIVELVLEHQEREGSVSNDDIQKITQSVYKEIRPNFRACYNWIRDFIKRHKNALANVELENVKKVFIPDDDSGNDGVLVQNYDPMQGLMAMDPQNDTRSIGSADSRMDAEGFGNDSYPDNSWTDLDSSQNMSASSFTDSPSSSVLQGFQKKPIIIAPPKSLDIKTEKKLVEWMVEQQQLQGCVYLDLFKDYAKSIHTGPKKFAATQAWMVKFKQRNHDALKNVVVKSRFRNEYTLEEKIAAVEEAKRLGCGHVGRKLGINGGVIYSWKVQIEQAEKQSSGVEPDTERTSFRGLVPEFEERIVELVHKTQALKNSVSYDDVSKHARSVYCETRPNFKGSYNWVIEFIRKFRDRFENVNFENQRKMLNDEEKLHILSEEKKFGTEHVMKKRNISASTIYNWKKTMHAKAIPIPKYKALVGNKIKQKYAKGKKAQKNYTDSEKRKMVAVAEENGITYASLKLGISRNMIAKWVKYFRSMGEDIQINFTPAATIKKGLEQQVATWVLEQNDQLGIVMTDRIQKYANKVFEEAYTNFSATEHWLEVFISQNAQKFENVRFREKGDTDLEFTEDIKLKLSRYAEKYGAVETANMTGLAPKNIYHWRRVLRTKGYDLNTEGTSQRSSISEEREDDSSNSSEPKSLMQQKLDKIEQKHSVEARKSMVSEALSDGTSAIASKYKIPLPLLLKWMKLYPEGYGSEDRKPDISSLNSGGHGLLKVRLPSIERAKGSMTRYSDDFKRKMCKEAQELGVKEVVKKHGIPNSTLYAWKKEFDEPGSTGSRRSVEKQQENIDSSRSSFDSEMDTSTPSTPLSLPIQNIKKEPVTYPVQPTSNQSSPDVPFRAVRRYSDEERMAVIQRALDVGTRAASKELDIPISNVLRWTNIYKKKQKHAEMYEKQKQKKQEKRAAMQSFNQSDSDNSFTGQGMDNVGMQHSGNYMSFSNLSHTSQQPTPPSQTTSQLVATPIRPETKERTHSTRYTEDERFNFVLESDIHGARAVAEKAGVSVDVMYKWRQKFSARPRIRESSTPLSSSSRSSSASQKNTPTESAPVEFDNLDSSKINDHGTVNEKDFHVAVNSDFQDDVDMNSDSDFAIVENTDYGAPDDFDTSVSMQDNNTTDSIISVTNDNLTDMPTIFQLENSAASKVLEMTTNYLDAEKLHENLLDGTAKAGRVLTCGVGSPVDDPMLSSASGTQEKGELDFNIQIVNVKSEAPE